MANKKHYYLTTPIYYVNDKPHIGHAYTNVVADVVARYKRLTGYDVMFLTGTDEHGQKIEQTAKTKNIPVQELVDSVHIKFKDMCEKMNITNNRFIRTTDNDHVATAQKIFSELQEKGEIYLGEYEGWYCIPCETYWTETQLLEGRKCPSCNRETSLIKEESYFFKLSKYTDKLIKHIEANPTFIQPEGKRSEVLAFLREGLRDLSISRTSFTWGIPVPNDPKHVIYVWFDALINYITAVDYLGRNNSGSKFNQFWGADAHIVGKDILRFHAVYWPAMLMSMGIELPKSICAHGWWTVNGQKMSKSLANTVDPMKICDVVGADALRYFFVREMSFGSDGDFSVQALCGRINDNLVNDYSNLFNRTLGMLSKYFGGVVPIYTESSEIDLALDKHLAEVVEAVETSFTNFQFGKGLTAIFQYIGELNRYIDVSEPWNLYKDESKHARLGSILYKVLDSFRAVTMLLSPVIPEAAGKVCKLLSLGDNITVSEYKELAKLNLLKAGLKLEASVYLFYRVDVNEMTDKIIGTPEKVVKQHDKYFGIDDFLAFDILAGHVVVAERIKKSDKLLKLTVDFGEYGERTVVAGIGKSYEPEQIQGQKIAFVANLNPAKLMGVESQGMILAAFDGERHHVCMLPSSVPAGTKIK